MSRGSDIGQEILPVVISGYERLRPEGWPCLSIQLSAIPARQTVERRKVMLCLGLEGPVITEEAVAEGQLVGRLVSSTDSTAAYQVLQAEP